MSRCFPYPPPGYSRNGASYEALIESIKLQKETDKAKVERKKEKRAQQEKKKEKQRRKEEQKAKAQKNPNELQNSVDIKEAHKKESQPTTEQLEKSDLTEEHGQPLCSSHKPSYSSDSTQNSNKRKREDDAILPSGTNGQGKPIKIRLLKKQKGPDSTNSARTDSPSLCGADTRANTWKISTSANTNLSVPSSKSLHEFNPEKYAAPEVLLTQQKPIPSLARPGTKNNDQQGLNFSRNQPAASSGRPILPSNSYKTKPSAPSGSRKNGVQGLHSSQKQSTQSSTRPILPPNHAKSEIPTSNSTKTTPPALSGSRKMDVQGLYKLPSAPSATEKKLISESNHVGPTRTEKKRLKKLKKYEKLIESWVPPVFQAQLPGADDDDEDWLARSNKTCRLSSGDDVGRCRELATSCSLWKPCAQFLAEADIYALPFTVPY